MFNSENFVFAIKSHYSKGICIAYMALRIGIKDHPSQDKSISSQFDFQLRTNEKNAE